MLLGNSEKIVTDSFLRYTAGQNLAGYEERNRRIDFFVGNQQKYTQQKLKRPDASGDDFPYSQVNITKWICRKLAMVYKEKPTRECGTKSDDYNNLTYKKDIVLKISERMTELLPVVAIRPFWDERKKIINYQIVRLFNGRPDMKNIGKFESFWYPLGLDTVDEMYVYWDAERYLILDNQGSQVKDQEKYGGRSDKKNIYGEIPFVFVRKGIVIDDIWDGGDESITNLNLNINLALTDLNWLHRYNSFKQVVIISDNDSLEKIKIGYNQAILLRTGDEGGQQSSASFLDLQADFVNLFSFIKSQLDLFCQTKGISMNWELQGSPSGFSLVVKNMELLNNWQDDIEFCRDWEYELFEMEKLIYEKETGQKFNFSDFKVNFKDVKFPVDTKDERENWQWKFDNNLATPIDYMKENDVDSSEEDIKKRYEENKLFNKKTTVFGTILE